MMKRIISLALCLCMVLSMLPVTTHAVGEDSLCSSHHPAHTEACGYSEESSCSLYPCAACAAEKAAAEEAARKAAEAEATRKAAEDEAAKKAAEDEAAKKAAEEEVAKKKAAEEEAAKKAAEEEAAKKKAAEEEAAKKASEEEAAKKKAAEEEAAKKKAAEEEAAKKKAAEEAAAKKAAEDAAKVKTVQDLIDALPDTVTQETKEATGNQLNTVIKAVQSLEESLQSMVNLSKYDATIAAMYELENQAGAQNPMPLDTDYPVYLRLTDQSVGKNDIETYLIITKPDGSKVHAYDDELLTRDSIGLKRGESYPISLPSDCGYVLDQTTKLKIPSNGYHGAIEVIVYVFSVNDLTVTVKDSLGNTLPGKTVSMVSVSGNRPVTGTTGSSGSVTFKNVRAAYSSVKVSADYTRATGETATITQENISMRSGDQSVTLTIPCETKVSVKVSGWLPDDVGKFDSDVSNATVTVKNKNNESVTLTHQSDGSYVGNAIRTAKGSDTFTVTVNAQGYQEKTFTVSSSGGAAISTSTELTMIAPAVTGLTNGQQMTVATEYPVTIDLNSVPEDAILSLISKNDKFRITGSDGSWKVYPVDAGSAEIAAGIGSNPSDPNELPVLCILGTYNVTAAKGTVAPPAAPALSGSADNATSETFTLPGDLKLAEKVTIRAQGGGIDKTEVYSGITAGQSLTMDFGKVIRGQVNYTYTYESSKTGYSGPAANSKGYYVLLDPSSVTFSHGSTMEYNGQQQVPTVSVAGLSEGEYTVSYGSVVGADTQYPLLLEDGNSFRYPNGMYDFTYTFVYQNTTKPLYYYVKVLGNEAQYIKGGAQSWFQITKRNLTITAQDQAISAGESIDDSKVTIGGSGLASGHTISYQLTPTTTAPGTKGAIEISNVKVKQGNTDVTAYYNITANNGELINKVAASSVTVELPESVTYNGAPQKPAVLKVGDKKLMEGTDYQAEYTENQFVGTAKVTFTSDCWEGEPIEKTFKIVPKNLTVFISGADKTYNGSNEAENAELVLNGIEGTDDVQATAAIAYADANAGINKKVTATGIALTGAHAKNYKLEDASGKDLTTLEGTGTISRRPVTVTGANKEKVYGEQDPEFTYGVADTTPLVENESLKGALQRVEGETAGTYGILQGTLTNDLNPNYDITYLEGTFTIQKRKVTVSGITAEKTYDGTTAVPTMNVEKARVSNAAEGESLRVAGAVGTFADKNAGTNIQINLTSITLASGENTQLSNYEIDNAASRAAGTIHKLEVVITPAAEQGKTYGDNDPELHYTVSGMGVVSEAELTKPLSRESGENAGTYGFQVKSAGNENFSLTLAETESVFTIRPFNLEGKASVTQPDPFIYSGADKTAVPKVTVTLGNGETYQLKTVDYTITGNKATKVGTYEMTVEGKGNFTGKLTVQWEIIPDEELLDDVLNEITEDNVNLSQKEDLEQLKEALDSADEETLAKNEDWQDAADKLKGILEKLQELDEARNTGNVEKIKDTTPENVTVDQKEDLEKAKDDLEAYLNNPDYAGNITDEDEALLENIEDCLAEIKKAEDTKVIPEIEAWLKENESKADANEIWLRKELKQQQDKIAAIEDETTRRIVEDAVGDRLDKMEEKLYTYKITKGNGQKWTKSSGKNLSFTANGDYNLFDYLLIDGKKVNSANYIVTDGSTIITLKASYLQTLKRGWHTIQMVYDDDAAEAYSSNKTNEGSFKIIPPAVNPATGDRILVPVTVMLVSAAALIVVLMILKKKKK